MSDKTETEMEHACIQEGRVISLESKCRAITWLLGILLTLLLAAAGVLLSLSGCTMDQAKAAEGRATRNEKAIEVQNSELRHIRETQRIEFDNLKKTLVRLETKIDQLEDKTP